MVLIFGSALFPRHAEAPFFHWENRAFRVKDSFMRTFCYLRAC